MFVTWISVFLKIMVRFYKIWQIHEHHFMTIVVSTSFFNLAIFCSFITLVYSHCTELQNTSPVMTYELCNRQSLKRVQSNRNAESAVSRTFFLVTREKWKLCFMMVGRAIFMKPETERWLRKAFTNNHWWVNFNRHNQYEHEKTLMVAARVWTFPNRRNIPSRILEALESYEVASGISKYL